jgi:putative transposase
MQHGHLSSERAMAAASRLDSQRKASLIHARQEDVVGRHLFWLTNEQLLKIKRYFPLSHGIARIDDLRVLSGIIYVISNGLPWKDAPKEYGPHMTLYNRFVRWSRTGVFNDIFRELVRQHEPPSTVIINSTHLKAHRTAARLLKKGLFPAASAYERLSELEAARHTRRSRQPGRTTSV